MSYVILKKEDLLNAYSKNRNAMLMDFKPTTISTPKHDRQSELIEITGTMTADELRLMIEIMALVVDRPDRQELARTWSGSMKDLPAALRAIV